MLERMAKDYHTARKLGFIPPDAWDWAKRREYWRSAKGW